MVDGTVVFIAFVLAPFILWLALHEADRWWSVPLRPTLRWMRILRFLGWGIGIALGVVGLAHNRFPVYGMACFAFSGGLLFPERWVKRHFVPEPAEAPGMTQ